MGLAPCQLRLGPDHRGRHGRGRHGRLHQGAQNQADRRARTGPDQSTSMMTAEQHAHEQDGPAEVLVKVGQGAGM